MFINFLEVPCKRQFAHQIRVRERKHVTNKDTVEGPWGDMPDANDVDSKSTCRLQQGRRVARLGAVLVAQAAASAGVIRPEPQQHICAQCTSSWDEANI